MSEQRIRFSAAGLKLEGALHMPSGETPFPATVVCHPHPLFGGDMSNNVVFAISSALAQAGIAAFRFNFRGVGGSQGSFAEGVGEQEDVKAALAFVSSITGVDTDRIGLVGYSFGAIVALPVAYQGKRVQALALISPPLSSSDWEQVKGYLVPKLFLYGSEDLFISSSDVQHFSQQLPPPSRFEVIPGADHFWWGYEGEVARRVSAFFSTYLQSP